MTPDSTQTPNILAQNHVDVLIVGAGLSGIGTAHHLQERCPNKSFVLLEARDTIGGTWDLFRYPGIRSDSDMYTFGYRFRPWTGEKTLADGPSILKYIRETAAEAGIDKKIRFGHRVVRTQWSSKTQRWTIWATPKDSEEPVAFSARFILNCSGYYRYDKGYTPDFAHMDDFEGTIVHPQHWPEDLDYSGKRVVVIGSGATAVTLVPAMAKTAGHVVMLQRSPTYIATVPSRDDIAMKLQRWLPAKSAYLLTRWKNIARSIYIYEMSQRRPKLVKDFLLKELAAQLPAGYPVDKHFTPRYNPWDQRLCAVPDGDFFQAISQGSASIVTDTIERFTPKGILTTSGELVEADIIVTATGFTLQTMGGAEIFIDDERVVISEHLTYKGMMLSDIPNSAFTVGYTNSSWTLKADLVSEYVCRLFNHMDDKGYAVYVPRANASTHGQPLLDFGAGYVQRSMDQLPKQGPTWPWRLRMNYVADAVSLRHGDLDDGTIEFQRPN